MYNFGFGGGFGGAPADSDPYADIALDLGSTAKADFSFPFDDAKPKKGGRESSSSRRRDRFLSDVAIGFFSKDNSCCVLDSRRQGGWSLSSDSYSRT